MPDYDAIAAQVGGRGMDYDALAAQVGGKSQPGIDREKLARTALEGTSLGERALINLGAGADTAWQGLRGLFGGGLSDAEVKEKRATDAALANNSEAGGALQFVGEVAPSLAIPGGAFVRGAQAMRALPAVARLGSKAAVID